MTVSMTIPATVHIRRGRLVGLVAGVAACAAALTGTVVAVAADSGSERSRATTAEQILESLSPEMRQHVDAVAAMTPLELAATYGTHPHSALDALQLAPAQREYVEGIMASSPEQLAAAYGWGV
jgi:hypothetical protein